MTETPSGPLPEESGEFRAATAAPKAALWAVAAFAALGTVFGLVSTSDFMQHLDRQEHSIHCSFIPGAGAELGDSGCKAVMMSPYSSFFRESLWGGIPVSLWAVATFAFLFFRAATLAMRGSATKTEANFLFAATALPVLMTLIYGTLSMVKVGETCKVCVGIYVASFGSAIAAFMVWRGVPYGTQGYQRPPYALWFFQGVGFVVALTLAYLLFTPGSAAAARAQSCGTLVQSEDPSNVMIRLASRGDVPAIEVLDPLCPSCRAFDERLAASSLKNELQLDAVLFPLDSSCNWMLTEPLHPGACAVSEAMLCANGLGNDKDPEAARKVLAWAFKHQESLRALAENDEAKLRARIERDFPGVKGCLGGTAVKNKLTKSLRWAVVNAIPVLTPQLFVRDRRLCDWDTDLGLEYTLRRAISNRESKGSKR